MAGRRGIRDEIALAWKGTRAGVKLGQVVAEGHDPDWEVTKTGKRRPVCSCGWKAPIRSKLSHSVSDIRDHLFEVYREMVLMGRLEAERVSEGMSDPSGTNSPAEVDSVSRTTPEVEHPVASVVFLRPG